MTTIMRVQQPAFIHVEDGIRLVDLKNDDEKYLKQNGFSKLPSCIQGVEFSCLGKYYQGFGFRNDIGGVEFFHHPGGFLHLLFQTGDLLFLFCPGHLHAGAALPLGGGGGNLNEIPDGLDNGLGHDTVGLVVGILNSPAALP